MMSHASSWERVLFHYTDDLGNRMIVRLNDYIGDAGGLERVDPNHAWPAISRVNTHLRHVRVRAVNEEKDGRRSFKNIPVQLDSPLWTGTLGQRILVAGQEMEVVRRVDEVEYGRKGAAAERKKLKSLREAD